jgi:hypothetical protein
MSSLRVVGEWYTQTASSVNALSGQSKGSFGFWWRPNAAIPAGFGGQAMLYVPASSSIVNIHCLGGTSQLSITVAGTGGNLSYTQAGNIGEAHYIVVSWDSTANQTLYVDNVQVAQISAGGSLATATGTIQVGSDGTNTTTPDFQIEDFWYLNGTAIGSTDRTGLFNRTLTPATISTPATHWWTFGGTANATASPTTDAGFLDQIGGTVRFAAPTSSGGGTGVYSPDTLNTIAPMAVLDAYIDRTGSLFYVFPGKNYLTFHMSGNSGQYTCRISAIRVSAGGSRYSSNPTATLLGGTPSRAAVLGTPIVVSGAIVGIPIDDGGAGYLSTDSLSVSITDPTGSGATCVVTAAGYPLAVTAVSGQPTIQVNGTTATLNTTTPVFWTSLSQTVPWGCYQLQTAANPGDVITWSASAGLLTTGSGTTPTVAASTPASNYTGVVPPQFRMPASGSLVVGANPCGLPGLTTNTYQIQANRIKNSFWSSGTLASDGRLISWTGTSASAYVTRAIGNDTDPTTGNPGTPFLQGPTLVAGGGGSGAVLVPVVVSRVIEQIFVKSGGTSYASSGSVTISHGSGYGATATYTAAGGVIQSVTVTAGGKGYSDGIWKLQYDDTAPGATATVATLSDTGGNCDLTDLSGMPSPLGDRVSAGSGGVGIRKAYYSSTKASATAWGPDITMTVTGGTVSGSTHTNGMTGEIIAPPNCELSQATGLAPDPNTIAWCNFGGGKYLGLARTIGMIRGIGGYDNIIRYAQFPKPADWSWRQLVQQTASDVTQRGTATITVTGIRPYDLSVSPKVYTNSSGWPGFVADGTVGAYSRTPSDRSWLGTVGNNTLWGGEFVTSTPHLLETLCYPTINDLFLAPSTTPGPSQLLLQNTQTSGVAAAPTTFEIDGSSPYVFVTGASTFVCQYGGASTGGGIPGAKSVYCTQDETHNSVRYVPVLTGGSGYTSQPAISIAQPSSGWLTAQARATTSGGVVQNTITIDSAGNNYQSTPTARIVASSGSGAVLSVTMSGSTVASISVTSGGSGYPTYVGVQIDPPGVTATASPNLTSGGVSSLTLVGGGAGYTGGAPEVIITGDGIGAKFTANLTGNAVTSFTQVSAGSGYTSANTSVAIAPPPSQATAYVSTITGGVIQVFNFSALPASTAYSGATVMAAGFGYGTTAPAVTISGGGASVQGTASATMAFPFTMQSGVPQDGSIPPEAMAQWIAAIPGCGGWWNQALNWPDSEVRLFAQAVLANVPRGRKHYVELGNELWNGGTAFHGQTPLNLMAKLGGQSLGGDTTGMARAASIWSVWDAVFTAAGRAGEVVHHLGSQDGNNAFIADFVSYANAHNIRIDAVSTAPYIDAPSLTGPWDPEFVTACASCASTITQSSQHGTSFPWTMGMYHSLWDHYVLYTEERNGTGQGGQRLGYFAGAIADLAAYSVPGSPTPQLVNYEGGIETPIPSGVGIAGNYSGGGTNDAFVANGLAHDFYFAPEMAQSVKTWHLMCLRGGVTASCYFQLMNPLQGQTMWSLVTNEGMNAGKGDGTDGLSTNATWVSNQQSHFLDNVSPALLGFQQTGNLYNPVPVTRRQPRWFPGLRRLPARAR